MRHTILGKLESTIMEIAWERGEISVRDVVQEINKKRNIAYTTVMTVMNRLVEKHILSRKAHHHAFLYRPQKTKEAFFANASKQVIDSLIAECGEVAVTQFVNRLEKVDPELWKRVKKLIHNGG